MSGYRHPDYARSLAGFGTPRLLPRSGAWILERTVPGTDFTDAMGCYPLFACEDWSGLPEDLNGLEGGPICLFAVTDPFGGHDPDLLRRCFPDVARPFKDHFVVDLSRSPDDFVAAHHRRYARRALRDVDVERVQAPARHGEEWVGLYAHLVERHGIRGIAAFGEESLRRQLGVPGIVAYRARCRDRTVGMVLWYASAGVGYYHLGACNEEGYALRAFFALFMASLAGLASHGLAWLDLGAGAGVRGDAGDGLTRFKRGWATGTRAAWFCGRILDRTRYEDLCRSARGDGTAYFPAYRAGEFA
jgi:hypothetical protein